jgi:hypothetical protein
MRIIRFAAASLGGLLLAACNPPSPPAAPPAAQPPPKVAPGLVALPCDGLLRPHWRFYCDARRNYVTADARQSLDRVTAALRQKYPDAIVRYLEASWPRGTRPMPPHLSHGDGRQLDIALFYTDRRGRPLAAPPTKTGYGAYEPPRPGDDRACTGRHRRLPPNDAVDPPAARRWRLDEVRTRDLIAALSADPAVRRIFIEPHLKTRLGFAHDPKVRFAGCRAARHDDHLHVDFR